uniref:Uncharacterized protein n=1 Tax=Plectus sambesii TaxID=2011161 RepID=A0A914XAC9_9BILA
MVRTLFILLAVALFFSALTQSYVIHKSSPDAFSGPVRKRTIDAWRNAYFFRELRHPGQDFDTDVLAEMDAMVRPRFG